MNAPAPLDDDRQLFYRRLSAVGSGFPATRSLVALNCAVFLAMVWLGHASLLSPSIQVITRWGSNFGPLTISGQWWRLLTAMFLHVGLMHLAVNMWSLFQIGALIERIFGSLHFLVLYLCAGLAGSLASLMWNPLVNSAGASGAVFGIIGGLLAFLLDSRNGVPRSVMAEIRGRTVLIVLLNLGFGFSLAGIDNAAHLGGLAGGCLAGMLLARPLDPEARRRQPYAGIAPTLLATLLLLAGTSAMLSLRLGRAETDWRARHSAALSGPAGTGPLPRIAQRRSNTAAMP